MSRKNDAQVQRPDVPRESKAAVIATPARTAASAPALDEGLAPKAPERNLCPVCKLCGDEHELRVEAEAWMCPRCSYIEPRVANAGA